MKLTEAVRWHATLAHALLGVWASAPGIHQVLHNYLGEWDQNGATSEKAFLADVAQHLKKRGASRAVVQAITAATVDGNEALEAIFAALVEKVRAEYEAVGSWGAGEHVLLKSVPQTDPVFPDPAPFCALGATGCVPSRPDSGGLPSSTVKLTFVPALLGPPTWASVPSVLCHELIAHVNQDAPLQSVDPFAEGWMDVVAGRYHEAWIGELFPQCRELAMASAKQLAELTTQRYPGLKTISDKTRAVRVTGTMAARNVHAQVTALVLAEGRPQNRDFERLSLQLNRVPASVEMRQAFVTAVLHALNGTDLRVARRWAQCVEGWLHEEVTAPEVFSFS